MSAFLVTRTHIDLLVFAWSKASGGRREAIQFWDPATERRIEIETDSDLGRMLWRENMLSLAARYDDPIDQPTLDAYSYTYRGSFLQTSVVTMLKAIACYEYQACEHEGWNTSKSKAYCEALRDGLISKLPGYSDAPWGVEDNAKDSTVRSIF
jgi:hypothetical protein